MPVLKRRRAVIKPTTDRAAIVDTEFHWIDAKDRKPPRGAKILCINLYTRVAVLGEWRDVYGFTHWAPLPTFKPCHEPAHTS